MWKGLVKSKIRGWIVDRAGLAWLGGFFVGEGVVGSIKGLNKRKILAARWQLGRNAIYSSYCGVCGDRQNKAVDLFHRRSFCIIACVHMHDSIHYIIIAVYKFFEI